MFSDWVSFLAYPNLFEIKGFVVVVDFSSSAILLAYWVSLADLDCPF
jgi:hypothetical protein